MFKVFKNIRESREIADESIRQSEAAAESYHETLGKNADAHADLMEKLDRRHDPRRMRSA